LKGVFLFFCPLGYQEALAKFTLKKFLLLVLFLDKAKTAHLIGYNPCLFCKDSDYKVCSRRMFLVSRAINDVY